MMYLLNPDDIKSLFSQPFFVEFWPLVLGTAAVAVTLFTGYARMAILVAALSVLLQAWSAGVFS